MTDFNDFQQQVIAEFRANEGRVGGPFEGSALVLLTTIGARSGKPRTNPLGPVTVDGQLVVVASAMGADRNPGWYHNLLRNPVVTVETGLETYEAIAVPRRELFDQVVAIEPGFGEYQQKTTRPIPVVTLTRIPAGQWDRGLGDFLMEAHDWLRAELAKLRRQVDELGDSRTGLEVELRAHCLEFCSALGQHHDGEDRGAFPMLAQRYPELAPLLDRLGAEHQVVATMKAELQALVDQPGPEFRKELENLATRLEEHLRYEERAVVSALNSLGPAPF